MSDEFIEQQSLRMRRGVSEPQTGEHVDVSEPPDPLTEELPFVVLEPPTEAQTALPKRDDTPTLKEPPVDLPQGDPEEDEPQKYDPEPPPSIVERHRKLRGLPEPEAESVMQLPRIVDEDTPSPDEDDAPHPPPINRETPPTTATEMTQELPPHKRPDAPVKVKRPEDTAAGEPVDAELMGSTQDDMPSVPALKRVPTSEQEKPPAQRALSMQQILLIVLFVLITLLLIFVPGVIATLRERQTADPIGTDVPQVPTDDASAGEGPSPTQAQARPDLVLLFASDLDGDFDIYRLDAATGTLTALTDNDANDTHPTWSPDGERILFVSDAAGSDDLWVMDADGSALTQVTSSEAADRSPSWAGEGVLFSRETAESSALLRFDAACLPDDCDNALLTIADDRFYIEPTWSPDEERIAATAAGFPGLPSVIGVLGSAAGDYTPLAGTGNADFYPAWGAAGIAFVSLAEDGGFDLWVQSPDGSAVDRITTHEGNDVEPAWAGDESLVFASDRGRTGDFDLYWCLLSDCEASLLTLTDNDADDLTPAVLSND